MNVQLGDDEDFHAVVQSPTFSKSLHKVKTKQLININYSSNAPIRNQWSQSGRQYEIRQIYAGQLRH